MSERIISRPAQFSVICVQLPGQEIELAHGEMADTDGGCILPGEDLFEYDPFEPLEDVIDGICDTVSEWWASW